MDCRVKIMGLVEKFASAHHNQLCWVVHLLRYKVVILLMVKILKPVKYPNPSRLTQTTILIINA